MSVRLAEVNSANYMSVLNLQVKEHQESFVASNAVSLAEAYVYDKNGDSIFPFAVYDDEELIGFVFLAYDEKIGLSKGNYLLFRLMIDKKYQGRGYFKSVMTAVVAYVSTFPAGAATDLWTSYEIENQHARQCYQAFGFKETGEIVDGELVALYPLTHY